LRVAEGDRVACACAEDVKDGGFDLRQGRWRVVQIFTGAVSQVAARNPMLGFSWKIRWIVFGVAIVDNYLNARWAALIGVILIAALSWSTGHFQKRWSRRLEDLGDQRAIAEGLGPDLADLIQRGDRSLAASERANRLRRVAPSRADGAGSVSGEVLRPLQTRVGSSDEPVVGGSASERGP